MENRMDIYKCTIVDIAYYENEKQVIVNVDIQDDIIKMSCEVNGICFSSSGEYYFDTFQSLRDRLLELGYGIKCNGSRINAIQSGMMGYSENIYLVEIGKQALNKDISRIWDYADIKDFPSTDEQKIYANKWYKSLDVFCKTGRELLSEKIVKDFMEYRDIQHRNIINKRLSEYTYSEWLLCLYEKVLLEQCLPYILEKVQLDPLAPGAFYKGELLYHITLIDKTFWSSHMELFACFKTIIDNALDIIKKELDNSEISVEYIEAYKGFGKHKK